MFEEIVMIMFNNMFYLSAGLLFRFVAYGVEKIHALVVIIKSWFGYERLISKSDSKI